MPEKLQELLYARLENPSATLYELGQALLSPVSKDGQVPLEDRAADEDVLKK